MSNEIKCPKCSCTEYFITKEGIVCADCNEIYFFDGVSDIEVPDIDPEIIER
jgi:hypothetical protein